MTRHRTFVVVGLDVAMIAPEAVPLERVPLERLAGDDARSPA